MDGYGLLVGDFTDLKSYSIYAIRSTADRQVENIGKSNLIRGVSCGTL